MKKLATLLIIAAMAIFPAGRAQAHVLITDTAKTKGAVLHITPDDDPIAGEPAVFFFDMQGQEIPYGEGDVSLAVTDAEGAAAEVEVSVSGTLATAEYVFPAQGAYKLVFTVASGGRDYTFEHSQRVSRGMINSTQNNSSYAWAEAALLFSILGILVLAIIVVNRREGIAAQSRF